MKRKRTLLFFYLLLVLACIGCDKSDSNCISSAGKVVKEVRDIGDFDSIDVEEYVNIILTQDTFNKVTVETGSNIMDGITTEVNNRQLYIKNNNKCNWLRSYNTPVNVYISVKNLKKIYYNSSGNVTTTNTIRSGFFKFEVWGGGGSIDMDLDIYESYFVLQMGTVDFTLRGRCAINTIYAGDYGFFQCKDLSTGYTFITNQGSNDCYVQASQYLQATVNSIGNIYYSGNPDTLVTKINGKGSIIPY